MSTTTGGYYFAPPSKWPVVGSTALFFFASGLVLWMNQIQPWGNISLVIGLGILFYMLNGLFSNLGVINSWPPPHDMQSERLERR